jgi:hypothetical protein
VQLDERVLDEVVRLVRVGGEDECPAVDDRVQRGHQDGERGRVAELGTCRERRQRAVRWRGGIFGVAPHGEHGRWRPWALGALRWVHLAGRR